MRQNVLGLPNSSPEKAKTPAVKKPSAPAPAASAPAAASVPRQYTNNTVLDPPSAAPAANSAGGTYNAAANRFTAHPDPQVRVEQERARAEAEHQTAAALQRQNNALAEWCGSLSIQR